MLLCGIHDDYIELLNFIGGGDVSQWYYDDIVELRWIHFRGTTKSERGPRDHLIKVNKATVGNILEDLKNYILGSLSSQLDNLQMNKKKGAELALAIFCVKWKRQYPLKEFPLNHIEVCEINMHIGPCHKKTSIFA